MGAREAIDVLGMLARYGAANRRTVREYVMEALCAGAEIRDGTAGYEILLESVGRDVLLGGPPDEPALHPETVHYLRQVLSSAADDGDGLRGFGLPYDGFSPEAYEEVYRLLGTSGRRYLGIRGRHKSLVPDGRLVRAMLLDEAEAEEAESRQEGPTWTAPLSGPPPGMGEPQEWNPHNPMDEPFPDLREYERWEPYWPELEGLPETPGFGTSRDAE